MRAEPSRAFAFGTLVATLVFFCACSKKSDPTLFPAGSPMASPVRFEYAVYMIPVHRKDPSVALSQALKSYPGLKVVGEIPKEPHEMTVSARTENDVQTKYAPPDLESLELFGPSLSPAQGQALQRSKEVFIVEFAHPKEDAWIALRAANSLVEEIARTTGGLVWDEETREVFTPEAWHKKRVASWIGLIPDMSTQTTTHIYPNGEFVRAISLGMAKAGLPDVVVADFGWSDKGNVGTLINLLSQTMAEGAILKKPGRLNMDLRAIKNAAVRDPQLKTLGSNASGWACLTLKQAVAEEGDPNNRLMQITPDRYAGNDVHAKRDRMLTSLFGATDSVNYVQHDVELLEASRKAVAKLPELQKAFNAGLQPGEFIQLKAPFATPEGGTEWMWVEVSHWEGNRVKGLLENDPVDATDLHAGQSVEIRAEEVFDYIRQYPDNRREGNTTGEIIEKMNSTDTVSKDTTNRKSETCDAD